MTPDAIHIYISGSQLNRGQHNPQVANGWGLVMAEMCGGKMVNTKPLCGRGTGKNNEKNIEYAALKALEDAMENYPPDVPVFIHTAQGKATERRLKRLQEGHQGKEGDTVRIYLLGELRKSHPELVEIENLARYVDISFIAAGSVNGHPVEEDEAMMEKAHRLARAAALEDRLAKQNYLAIGNTKYTGAEAKRYIEAESGWER